MNIHLYPWQEECLNLWLNNGCKGIVNVVTGAGKTILAAAAIKHLAMESDSLKIKIVVPKTFLLRQWSKTLRDYLQAPREDIGVYSGSKKSGADKKYMIYVINSARYSLARHILNDLSESRPVLLIADECHHYGTEENAKIFDFYPWRLKRNDGPMQTGLVRTLGLSATPFCEHYSDVLEPCLGREIYSFSFERALSAGIINKFAVFHICLNFDSYEQESYDEITDKISIALSKLIKLSPGIGARDSASFFRELRYLTGSKDNRISETASALIALTCQRRDIVYHAGARTSCVLNLLRLISDTAKVIIFGERIETANEIYNSICELYPNEAGIYHSGVHKHVGESALKRFECGEIRILVSCKTLDEGLSVSGADVGIIVSSTNSNRQRIQRLGRILRKKNTTKPAYFYYLYIDGTTEQSELLREHLNGLERHVSVIDIYYNDITKEFFNNYYSSLTEALISRSLSEGWSSAAITELSKHFKRGLITCDWWLTGEECANKIKEAGNKTERNYYKAMQYLISERSGGRPSRRQ